MNNIRNFCIIAHIDHGKSTFADRLLEITETVPKREMKEQLLDQMDLERERGITIKLQPVRMNWRAADGQDYVLNLIDTPGHVDFTYEVSRSLAACEGAILLVDATQGVQAQTISNLYLALEQNLTVIPVINKIDLPNAQIEKTRGEIVHLLGLKPEAALTSSGKTGAGVRAVLEEVVRRVPPPPGDVSKPFRALIFDSIYDEHRGVIAYVRAVDGSVAKGSAISFAATSREGEVLDVGYFRPKLTSAASLAAGEIGYIATGLKEIEACRVGDTIVAGHGKTTRDKIEPLAGYKEVVPMVFAGIFPREGDAFSRLREAVMKLKLNDAALTFEPERSTALGFGFRVGLLGLLHLEIVQERLRREYGLDVVVTAPSVAYTVFTTAGRAQVIKSPLDLPDRSAIDHIEEPWVSSDIVAPKDYIGGIMGLVAEKRGVYKTTEYLGAGASGERIILHYELPLASILVDFYDKLKSVSSGYASFNYEFLGYRPAEVVRLDILVAGEAVEALATICYEDAAYRVGREIVAALKEKLPREQFEIKIQAAIGGKIIAAERIAPLRKDVTGYLYGGDVTRKRKLLEKQKKGKKKLAKTGRVNIPPEAYLAVLRR